MDQTKVKIVIDSDGTVKEGELHPAVGTTIEVHLSDAAVPKLGIDYKDPDSLKISLGGDFRIDAGKAGGLELSGGIKKSLLDGSTSVQGTVTWEFPKNVSVVASADLDNKQQKVGLKLTLRF